MFDLTNELSDTELEKLAKNFDHHSPEYRSHSIDILDYMQRNCPFSHSPNYGGFWVATKADDCLEIAKNVDDFSNWPAEVIPALEPTLMIPLNVDPPELYDYRAVLNPLFSPMRVKEHANFVRSAAQDLLDKILANGGGDLVQEYALPLTATVTLKLIGMNPGDWPHYATPNHELTFSGKPMEERLASMAVMVARMRDEIRRMKEEPVPGSVVEYLYNVEMAGRKLRLDEIDSIVLILIGGGVDTTQSLFGKIAVHLGRNPDHRQQLIDEPGLCDNAIEEFLRVYPPTQGNSRRVKNEVTIAGRALKPEEQVFMSYAAANRDPDEYDDPHKVNFRRPTIRHNSFGLGPHRCLGSHLARLEARTMLEVLLQGAPDYQLDEENVILPPDIGFVAGYTRVQIKV